MVGGLASAVTIANQPIDKLCWKPLFVFRLLNFVTSDTPGTDSESSYGEDQSDNLTTLPTGASGTYDYASELTSSTAGMTTTDYTYDASGNRTAESTGATVSATYNGAGELTSYDNSSADLSTATYNGLGLRTSETSTPSGGSASTQGFAWDTNASIPVLLEDSTYAYIYGPSGTPFEQIKMSTGTVKYLNSDALGSVRGVVSSSGSLSASTSYGAWGAPETTGGLTSSTPFGFAGAYTDSTKLLYLENRYYDPSTGDFFSVDPDVMDTGQAYGYAGDDPVDGVDPTGDGPISGVGQSNAATTSLGRAQVLSEARASAASQQCAQAQFLAYVSSEGEFLHSEYQAEQWAISNDAPGAIQLAEKYGNDAGVFATNVSSYVNNVGNAATATYGLYTAVGDQVAATSTLESAYSALASVGNSFEGVVNEDSDAALEAVQVAEAAVVASDIGLTYAGIDWFVALIGLFS